MIDRKIQAIHKYLDAFELRILERPAPTIDVTAFETNLARLWANADDLLAPIEEVPDFSPEVEEGEVVMTTIFGDIMPPLDHSHVAKKRHCFDHTTLRKLND